MKQLMEMHILLALITADALHTTIGSFYLLVCFLVHVLE